MTASHDWTHDNAEIQALRESLKAKEAENLELVKRNQYLEEKLRGVQFGIDNHLQSITSNLASITDDILAIAKRPPDETI